ncbi:MAG: long-chain fatty acid--CoA ligase [Thermoplasmatales archaeon]
MFNYWTTFNIVQHTSENGRIWLKVYDKGIPADVECKETKPYDFLKNTSGKVPERLAVVFFNYKINFKTLNEKVGSFASFLKSMGVAKGDRVALDLPNCPQYIIAYYAINKIGAVVTQISPTYFKVEINRIIEDSGAKVLIIFDDLLPRITDTVKAFPNLIVVATRIEDYLSFPLNFLYGLQRRVGKKYVKIPEGYRRFKEFESFKPEQDENNDPNSLAVLQYTGGTTGVPKGAMLTNKNLVCNTIQSISTIPNPKFGEDTMLSVIPFFHVFGMTVAMNFPIKIGATMVLQPKPDVDGIFKLIKKYHPSFFPGVPTLYSGLLSKEEIHKIDMKSVQYCLSGSAPLPVEIIEQWDNITGGHLVEGYGLTEASPVTHVNPFYGRIKAGSIGIPLPSTYAKIVDIETGTKEMPVNSEGELIIKGPQVMQGYYKNPQETAMVLKNGWLYTGDIGKMDEEGYFYIVDRKKDVIIVGGFNVYPREIEEILYQNPKVKEAAAVGVKEAQHGEVVKAFVVLKDGQTATEEEIKEFFQGKIAKFKIPRYVEFRKELPKTLVGKILRRELREKEEGSTS